MAKTILGVMDGSYHIHILTHREARRSQRLVRNGSLVRVTKPVLAWEPKRFWRRRRHA